MTDLVATLIARPEQAEAFRAVTTALAEFALADRIEELSPAEAADVFFASHDDDIAGVRRRLEGLAAEASMDIVVQEVAHRRKRLFVADMDSTMIGQECIDELADMVGLKAHVSAITERAMRGEIAFEPALRERVALLAGLPVTVVDQVIVERIRLTSGAGTLVATMRAAGAYTALVSGGFTLFTSRVAVALAFHEDRANRLVLENGLLAGRVAEPILGREAKLATLLELRQQLGVVPAETMAVGDGANDLAMIREAGLGVAYHAKPRVAAEAAARIDHADLTALLFAQGYRRAEFLTPAEPVSI